MLRTISAALVFLIGVALLALADAPFVRYASIGSILQTCAARQFENLPQHMDVLVLGSSRMRRGVDPQTFITDSNGRIASAYNLAAPGKQLVRSAVIFDEILNSGRDVGVLIVEIDIDAVRRGRGRDDGEGPGWSWAPMPAGRASWLDIITKTPRLVHGLPDPRLVLQGLREKLEQALLLGLSGTASEVVAQPFAPAIPVCWHPEYENEGTRGQLRRLHVYADRAAQRFPHPQRAVNHRLIPPRTMRGRAELQLLDSIRARAREAGVKVIVVRLQGYGEPPLDRRLVEQLQRLIPEFRYPPEALVRRLSTLQVDGSHLGLEGKLLYSHWLTETVLAERAARPAHNPAPGE